MHSHFFSRALKSSSESCRINHHLLTAPVTLWIVFRLTTNVEDGEHFVSVLFREILVGSLNVSHALRTPSTCIFSVVWTASSVISDPKIPYINPLITAMCVCIPFDFYPLPRDSVPTHTRFLGSTLSSLRNISMYSSFTSTSSPPPSSSTLPLVMIGMNVTWFSHFTLSRKVEFLWLIMS